MKIYSYCEASNQVAHLGVLLPEFQAKGYELVLFITPKIDVGGVIDKAREIGVTFVELDEKLDETVAALKAKGIRKSYLDACIDLACEKARLLMADGDLFLTFNDGTLKAAPLGRIARELGLKTMTVQDGFHGFEPQPEFSPWWYPLVRRFCLLFGYFPDSLKFFVANQIHRSQPFGKTHPDYVFLFGKSAEETMRLLYGVPKKNIHIVGSLLIDKRVFSSKIKRRENPEIFSVFYPDQNFVRQRKMRMQDWQKHYPPFILTLASFTPIYKFHPSESEEIRNHVEYHFGAYMRLDSSRLITDETYQNVDMVVTLTSSTFLNALANGKPVVTYRMPKLFDRFPKIKSPLLRVVDELDELEEVISTYRDTGVFKANRWGKPLNYFIRPGDAKAAILKAIEDIADKRKAEK